jgi:hypothetical protein
MSREHACRGCIVGGCRSWSASGWLVRDCPGTAVLLRRLPCYKSTVDNHVPSSMFNKLTQHHLNTVRDIMKGRPTAEGTVMRRLKTIARLFQTHKPLVILLQLHVLDLSTLNHHFVEKITVAPGRVWENSPSNLCINCMH